MTITLMVSFNGGSSWTVANSAFIGPAITSAKDPDIHDAIIGMGWGGAAPTHVKAVVNNSQAFNTAITVEGE